MKINKYLPRTADVSDSKPYQVSVKKIISLHEKETIFQQGGVYLGISLCNNSFVYPKLLSMIDWISKKFSKCDILIADSIHRITLSSYDSLLKESLALKKALAIGNEKVKEIQLILDSYQEKCDFNLILCSEIQKHREYKKFYNKIDELYKTNLRFKNLLEECAKEYLRKKSDGLGIDMINKMISFSCQYFKEELAIVAFLQKFGLSTMIYPGTFPALDQILKGEYPELPCELQQVFLIILKLRRRSWFSSS